jgi:hypothetical protein
MKLPADASLPWQSYQQKVTIRLSAIEDTAMGKIPSDIRRLCRQPPGSHVVLSGDLWALDAFAMPALDRLVIDQGVWAAAPTSKHDHQRRNEITEQRLRSGIVS